MIEEYNQLVSTELGSTKKEIADINNQIRDLYRTKLDLVSEAESNIYDVIEYYAEKQVDAQKEALEKVQDARKKMREEDDYERNKAEKMKELADLESQIEILSRDGSRAGQQKLAELKQQYADLMNDLNDVVTDNQDKLFDEMISNETASLEKQLKQFLDPDNVNKTIADALNSGYVTILDTTYSLQDAMAGYLQETEIGLVNTIQKTNEWVDSLNQAKSSFVAISDAYAQLGYDGTIYGTGQNFNNQIEGSNNAVTNVSYTLQFPENISALDREEILNIIQPALEQTKAQTIDEVTKALNGK